MLKGTKRFSLLSVFIILAIGVVFGGIITYLTRDISALNWLNIGYEFGLKQPLMLDLYVIKLTFGLTANINVAVILGTVVAALFYRFVF
ncbi:MAG: DUF4321 domain-containing protein [Clostridia bacterium]|nr:DUF4321 domain-containing protein [Clostridia bacterium]